MSDAGTGLPLAAPWKRFVGALIDNTLFVVLGLATLSSDGTEGRAMSVAWFVIAAIYEIGLTATRGQTLGKMAVTTQVVDRSQERLPAWNQAVVRWLVPAVPNIAGLIVMHVAFDVIGVLWLFVVYLPILRSLDRRGWHDRAAGTVVIDRALVPVD